MEPKIKGKGNLSAVAAPTNDKIALPKLEAPPEPHLSPDTYPGMLLESDGLAHISTQLAVLEGYLKVLVKNVHFDEFMREVLTGYLKAIKCEAGSILEADKDAKFLFFRATAGQSSDRLSSILIPWGKGIVGHVAESRQPTILSDLNGDSRFLRSISSSVGFDSRNLIAAPIMVRDRVFCVVELFNRVGRPTFDEQDLKLLVKLSEFAGKVIEVRLMLNSVRKANAA